MRSPRRAPRPSPRKVPKAPTEPELREAAVGALAIRALSIVGLERALARRIASWARRAERAGTEADAIDVAVRAAEGSVPAVVARMVELGLLNDEAFAERRAEHLARAGKSRRAIARHLESRGVSEAIVREKVPHDANVEVASAIRFAKRRRLGCFARASEGEVDAARAAASKQRALGALARAGFSFGTADRVLRLTRDEAEALLQELQPRDW